MSGGRAVALACCVLAPSLALGLAGCGGGAARRGRPVTVVSRLGGPGAGQGRTFTFTGGGSVPGTVYLGLGPDLYSLDAYRLSGPLRDERRITYSPLGLGLEALAAGHGEVVVQRECCGGLQFLEQLDLARSGGLPGRVIGPGEDPAVSPGGRLAYVLPDYRSCRCDAVFERPGLVGAGHLVYEVAHPAQVDGIAWGPSEQLAVLAGTLRGVGGRFTIVLDPGTAGEQRISPGPNFEVLSGIWFGPQGQLSWQQEQRLVIRSPSGRVQSVPVVSGWQVNCWLSDGRLLALGQEGALGTLDPATGQVATIGHTSADVAGLVFDCPLTSSSG